MPLQSASDMRKKRQFALQFCRLRSRFRCVLPTAQSLNPSTSHTEPYKPAFADHDCYWHRAMSLELLNTTQALSARPAAERRRPCRHACEFQRKGPRPRPKTPGYVVYQKAPYACQVEGLWIMSFRFLYCTMYFSHHPCNHLLVLISDILL